MNLEQLAKRSRLIIFIVAVIGLVALLVGVGLLIAASHNFKWAANGPSTIAGMDWGFLLLGIGVIIACLAWMMHAFIALRIAATNDEHWKYEQLRGALETQRQLLESIRDSAALSDSAKQIAYRHKDRDTLRHAIREDIEKNDYDGAYWLAAEMERRFGNRQEAAQFREMVETARRAFIEREVHEAIDHFSQLLKKCDWPLAAHEIELLEHNFPGHPEVKLLAERLQVAKEDHKRLLLKEWKDAVSKDDVDLSVQLLKQLDQYLTPGEAEGFKEIARDVFKKQLQQLGVQFALQCNDKNWAEAVRIGQQIIDQFPNTRIAAEVREVLPSLREKSNHPAVAI